MFNKISKFLKDVKQELRNVAWPTKDDLKEGTTIVIAFSIILGIFIWIVDNIFTQIVNFVIFR
ncbi:MAG: preprotein translocase subunit SecE [Candidatus Cloacimonetes bacterium]|nr:preprotein translocase subunit SecE [Candidatus Cloacimonadota bacterium]MBL7086214.1 preprotein translocase subunit SecE [Candidatus Cloacimonadota bacterium]